LATEKTDRNANKIIEARKPTDTGTWEKQFSKKEEGVRGKNRGFSPNRYILGAACVIPPEKVECLI